MTQIFAIAIVVLLVTLIGHGFWLVLAALWHMISPRTFRCQVCAGVLQHGRCLQCGWSGAFPNPDQPLELTRHILRQAYAQGLIDKQQLDSISQAVTCVIVSPDSLDTPSSPSSLVADVADERGSNQSIVASPQKLSKPNWSKTTPRLSPATNRPTQRNHQTNRTGHRPSRAHNQSNRRPTCARRRIRFAAAAVVAEPVESAQLTEPPKPKRSFNEVFAAFMEEKNIRWGEVVGGLLIVSCSIALVVSFWTQIAAMPLLKFGVFTGVTAALFGVGLHASHRWKLPTTSQGVLMIAMLLVPLNFLALASFTDAQQVSAATVVGEMISLGIFSFCGYHAAKVLTPKTPALTTCIVASLSVFHLLVRRFVPVETNQLTTLGIYVPAISIYALSVLPAYWQHRANSDSNPDDLPQNLPSSDDANLTVRLAEIWKGLGLATFAFVLLTSFLVLRSNDAQGTLQAISPVSSLMAMPLLLTGMIVGRMASVRRLSAEVIAATSVGLLGVLVLLSGCVLSVPRPSMMILTSCLSGAVLLGLGQAVRIRQTHYASGAMWAAAATLLGLVVRGQIQWNANSLRLLLDAILSAETGFLLTGVAVVFAALFIVLRRMGKPTFADIYGHLSGVAAAIGFLFVTGFGFGRIESATSVCLLYVLYAAGCYVAAHVSGRRWLEGVGATLLTLASAQAIAFPVEPHWGWAAAWSLAAAVASTVLYVIDFGYRTWRKTPFDAAAPTPQAAI
ncbi:MAG: hypothetical protein R3C28_12605 [Pirellulaceae bacterium]